MPFRDVVGHRRLVGLLSRSIGRGRLPQSLLFAGPAGVGKRLVAVATAQALNCTRLQHAGEDRAIELDACGSCPSCLRIARGVHADVLLAQPGDSGSIKIEQIRDINERAPFRPFEGRRRVVIVDEADAIVAPAQNALLKTLEEPPSMSVFVLVTSRPDMLLPTVLSRLHRLRFRPLAPGEVAAALMKQGRSESEAFAVAAAAGGSIGSAMATSAEEVVEARDTALRVLSQAAANDGRRRLSLDGAKELLGRTGGGAGDREELAVHLRALSALVRDIELLGTGASHELLANPDVRATLDALRPYRGDRGVRVFAAIDRALAALDRNAGVKTVADWVALELRAAS